MRIAWNREKTALMTEEGMEDPKDDIPLHANSWCNSRKKEGSDEKSNAEQSQGLKG